MKKKFYLYLLFAIILGFISAQIVYSNYKDNIINSNYNSFFIVSDDFVDNSLKVSNEDGRFNYYLGITSSYQNANKIKNIYDNKSINTVIEPKWIDSNSFMNNLVQYDSLLSEINKEDSILSVNEAVLSSYNQFVLGND